MAITVAILWLTPQVAVCAPPREEATDSPVDEKTAERELLAATSAWLSATVAGDFSAQGQFYPETMDAFYLWRDVPKAKVMAEKRRVFAQAEAIDIDIEPPQVLVDTGGRSARMYFRKTYVIKGQVDRRGEVLQELRWVKEGDGWKITSERDLSVIHRASRER
ncbi:MAG: hypothetical protein ABW110_04530 [Steroidobacteraceae bacterium]